MSKLTRFTAVLGAVLGLTACMGTVDGLGTGGASGGLVEVAPGTQPLLSFDSNALTEVEGACEDRIPGEVEFQIAGDGRVVALNIQGEAICTDSVTNLQQELADLGRTEEASSLGAAYLVTLGLAVPGGWDAADPSPQPSSQPDHPAANGMQLGSTPADGVAEADPSPQPS